MQALLTKPSGLSSPILVSKRGGLPRFRGGCLPCGVVARPPGPQLAPPTPAHYHHRGARRLPGRLGGGPAGTDGPDQSAAMGQSSMEQSDLKVAVGGFGAIGKAVAAALDKGIAGLELVAVSARDGAAARAHMQASFSRVYEVLPLDQLAAQADVVVECCPAHLLETVARPALEAGRIVIVISVGALLANAHLKDIAEQTGGRILVPSGALLGLDAVQAAAEGTIESVTMITRKPPNGLKGAPAIERLGLDLDAVTEPVKCYEGSAHDAIEGFPANLNVAVALGLAGIGTRRTRLEVWADPTVQRNTHTIHVVSDSADLTLKIENIPSDENPKTGKITALSIISTLKRLKAPLVISA